MSLRKSPPETIIDQSIAQKNSFEQPGTELTTVLEASSDKEAVDLQSSASEESEDQKICSSNQRSN
jgi:hypothetical protein